MNDEGTSLDPHKIWNGMFINEKPGGHGERSVASAPSIWQSGMLW